MNNEILARWQGRDGRYRCTVDGPDCGECVVDDPNHDINDCNIAPTLSNKTACQYWVNDMDYLPDYPNDDAAAMSLLDTLVEKGYTYQLLESFRVLPGTEVQHRLRFGKQGKENLCGMVAIGGLKPTRREAIIAACLEVARKELEG